MRKKTQTHHHVCNFSDGDYQYYLSAVRLSKIMGMSAWISQPVLKSSDSWPGLRGFYVSSQFYDLSEMWANLDKPKGH